MQQRFYQYFIHKTDGFVFSDDGQQESLSWEKKHACRVQRLVDQVRKMAITYHYKTPAACAKGFDQDDWVQQAMITMFECCESYDRKRPFDHYVRFIVKRRLEDQRRKLYRQNPKVKTDKTRALQDHKRLFSDLSESVQRKAQSATSVGPERHYLMKEAHRILLNCLHRIGKTEQMLFAKHELENVSFKKLFKLMPAYNKSFATFKRWYASEIFDRVRLCVQSQLPD